MRFSSTKLIHNLLLLTSLLLAACGGGGGSSGGTTTVAAPAAPADVSATAGCSTTMLYINWSLATGATGYNVYRSTAPSVAVTDPNKITATPVTVGSYIDTGLSPGSTYYYKVTAVNSGGASSGSTEASATAPASSTCTQMGGSFQDLPLTLSSGVSTLAGAAGFSGTTDGTGTTAQFNLPQGITSDGTNLYVADTSNHTIRKIVIATGAVTTLAGTAGSAGSTDGTGAAARFSSPAGITTDGTNLYVADTSNHTIRQIVISTGVVTTLAGTAGSANSTDGTGAAARFSYPAGITTDGPTGLNLYVADAGNHTIRQIVISTGVVTTLAGTAGSANSTDGTGAAARFNGPQGITTDGTNLYIADTVNHTIRQIVISTGVVTTLAGTAGSASSTDGTGAAARFNGSQGITSDGTNLYVADTGNHTIRKIAAGGVVTTVEGAAGTSGTTDGTLASARFNTPTGITTDGTSLYDTDAAKHTIRMIQ